jgi:hypothetical protein
MQHPTATSRSPGDRAAMRARRPFAPAAWPVFYGWPVVALVLGNGMGGGLAGLLGVVAWARLFGRRHLGAIGGLHLSVTVLFSAIGPVLFSQSLAWSGSYRAAAGISALAAALLFAVSFRIRAPARDGEGDDA